MRKRSSNYSTPDAGGWMHKCDDLFLSQFRGKPCEVCGQTHGWYNGREICSMGHHLLSKELHRLYRYHKDNIVVLCPKHHLGSDMSPHSHDTAAQDAFSIVRHPVLLITVPALGIPHGRRMNLTPGLRLPYGRRPSAAAWAMQDAIWSFPPDPRSPITDRCASPRTPPPAVHCPTAPAPIFG